MGNWFQYILMADKVKTFKEKLRRIKTKVVDEDAAVQLDECIRDVEDLVEKPSQ